MHGIPNFLHSFYLRNPAPMATMYQTAAMTSCCSIANLTLKSTMPGADGKRMWSVDGSRWDRWKEALAEAGCSAGLEGQDGRARSPGALNWYNMSVCGPRALCMPYNPVAANTTSWAFTCACAFGEQVDSTSPENGIWNPNTLCTTLNTKGWFTLATYILSAIFYLGILVYAIDTFVRLRKHSSKGCCAQKLTCEIAGIIVAFALAVGVVWAGTIAQWGMMCAGIDHHLLKFVVNVCSTPLPLLNVFNVLIVAVTCTFTVHPKPPLSVKSLIHVLYRT